MAMNKNEWTRSSNVPVIFIGKLLFLNQNSCLIAYLQHICGLYAMPRFHITSNYHFHLFQGEFSCELVAALSQARSISDAK